MNQNLSEEILGVFVEKMENRGESRNLVHIDIDESMLKRINNRNGTKIDLEQLYKYADRCLANEWLEQTAVGVGKYRLLAITQTGVGVVRSRQKKIEALENRTSFKKLADYIDDHKGLFILLGAAIAIASLLVSLFVG
ncbi:hypothetical protein [uncultured Lamprocystis sp.]|jgi:hypothetical protein|uniref:hypothetical protein n=1 Tax=uncultured Lamprocystis sp. TaxID=543132 RepID=UPI0025D12C3F|nr:hypothetical protein [uncultured Lamprocystis sp.]